MNPVTPRYNRGMRPLRKIVSRDSADVLGTGTRIPQDHLECGHRLAPAEDIIGRRYPSRRRCFKCAKGLPVEL